MKAKTTKTKRQIFKSCIVAITGITVVALALASCSHSNSEGSGTITLYSGRSESLIQPLINTFESESGIKVNVRYGSSADLALLINEEGSKSPADIFISQSPGALGFLESKNRLANLPSSIANKVRENFRSSNSKWVGLTGRERVLVYNTNVPISDLPNSIDDLTDSKYRGRVAIAPRNGSFQDFITAMRLARGDDATEQWLQAMANNQSPNYAKNSAIVSAVIAGEVDMGLVNHYYLLRQKAEDPNAPAKNYFFPPEDIGALLIVTAGAIIKESSNKSDSEKLLEFLLNENSQNTFVQETREYSLLPNIDSPEGVPTLHAFADRNLLADLNRLGEALGETLALIEKSGIIR